MTTTSERILKFSEELTKIKLEREKLYQRMLEGNGPRCSHDIIVLSEKIHVMTEFMSMFNALFFQELEEAKQIAA